MITSVIYCFFAWKIFKNLRVQESVNIIGNYAEVILKLNDVLLATTIVSVQCSGGHTLMIYFKKAVLHLGDNIPS